MRSLPTTLDDFRLCNVSTECPYCGDRVSLVPVAGPVLHSDRAYFIALCPNWQSRTSCKPIFAVYQALNNVIEERYPIPSFDASRLHASVPEPIREDYAEAMRCEYADSFKATVVLCRRVVEAVACDKLGPKSRDEKGVTFRLQKLVDLLHIEGFITKDLKESAHEIRHFGNYGAHAQDDGLDHVTKDEAAGTRTVTWQFLFAVYMSPAQTQALRKARVSKGRP